MCIYRVTGQDRALHSLNRAPVETEFYPKLSQALSYPVRFSLGVNAIFMLLAHLRSILSGGSQSTDLTGIVSAGNASAFEPRVEGRLERNV